MGEFVDGELKGMVLSDKRPYEYGVDTHVVSPSWDAAWDREVKVFNCTTWFFTKVSSSL